MVTSNGFVRPDDAKDQAAGVADVPLPHTVGATSTLLKACANKIESSRAKKPRRKEKQEAKEAAREMRTEKASAVAGGQLNAERSKEKMAVGTTGDKLAAESSGSYDKHESRRERQDRGHESKRRRKYERSGPDRADRPRREKDRSQRDAPDHIHKEADSSVSQRQHQGKDKKHKGNFVLPGQKPMPISNFPNVFGYPGMCPVPMLGLSAPNPMMTGGISHLIGNLKALNLQMAAAIVQA